MTIYLDYHAATPLTKRAREMMQHAIAEGWANPSSVHAEGRRARRWVEDARRAVASAIHAEAPDVIFTSGGTEACNLGVFGVASGARHILTTRIEHPSVREAIRRLADGGAHVTHLAVPLGVPPSAADFRATIENSRLPRMDAAIIGWVNHETGTRLPIHEYGLVCKELGVRLFVDATVALGKVPVEVGTLGADAVAFAASKIGGPTGAGALWVARGIDFAPRAWGGAQERGRRAGTSPVAALAGFGAAASEIEGLLQSQASIAARRDRIEEALVRLGGVVNGDRAHRVSTVTNVSFRNVRGDVLVMALDVEGVAVSAGAACSSGVAEPSPVIAALHENEPWRATNAVRVSLGPSIDDGDVETAIEKFDKVLSRIAKYA